MTHLPNDHDTETRHWANRALGYARALADALPGRGSATPAEAAAAEHVRRQLVSLNVEDLRLQTFRGQRSIWLHMAQIFGMALVGHAAFWLLPRPLGEMPALLVALVVFGVAFFRLWRKFTFHPLPMPASDTSTSSQLARTSLPSGTSQNLIAVLPPSETLQRRVVLLAHLDSHRAVWVYAHPLIALAYSILTPLALYGTLVAPLLYALALVTHVPVFGWLGLALALIHFVAWFTGVTADLGPYSPGANDNASAVGSLLALAERLQAAPLACTEVWLVFTGCEESGGDGMLQLLAAHGETLREALFINLELVGIGDRLAYLETEGMLRRRSIHPGVRNLVQQAAGRFAVRAAQSDGHPAGQTELKEMSSATPEGICPVNGSLRGFYTEMNIAWEHGFQGVCLMVQSSTEAGLPQWHRLTDTSRHYQSEAFGLAQGFVWELLQAWDKPPRTNWL